ncbi:MAG: Na+/H+ antiporter subunit E [Gammaproteobacteria bacterium]
MSHILSLGAVLIALWLLLSGIYYPLFFFFALASTALVLWIAARMDVADHEGVPVHLGLRTFSYWPWLSWQMFKSNVDVARRVLSPSLPISPCSFEVKALQRTPLGRTIFANSITLTPGTVSMTIEGDRILVHALTEETRDNLLGGTMNQRACDFEGSSDVGADL